MAVEWWNYLIAVLFIPIAYFLSIIAIKLLLKLEKLSAMTKSTLDDRIIANLRGPIKVIFVFIGIYIALSYVIHVIHPGSSNQIIYSYTVSKDGGQVAREITLLELFNKAFFALGAFIAAYTVTKIIKGIFEWYLGDILQGSRKRRETIFKFSQNIIYIVVYLIAFLIILSSLSVDITPMIAGLGIGGLAVALAAQDTLSNFLAGAYLSADQPIRVGDFIELSETEKGHVEEISWRNTKLRTLNNNIMIIPNLKLANSVITNYEKPQPQVVFWLPVGVGYNSNLEKVEKVTLAVATDVMKNVKGAVPEFKPSMAYREFGDFSINFSVVLAAKEMRDKFLVTHEFIKRLKKAYDKAGIEIPFPQRVVQMKK